MKNKPKTRLILQIFFFGLIALLSITNALAESGTIIPWIPQLSLHAICPFGGVVTLYNLATVGDYIQKIHASSVIILGLSFLLAIVFGPVFCGWVCPLGSIQEWIGKIGHRLFKKKYNHFVSSNADKFLRYTRYLVLAWVVYITAKSGTLVFVKVDPYYALFNFYTGEVAVSALVILGIVLSGSLFVERPWCKYACPYGAVLGLTNKFRIFKIRRNVSTCIDCKKCDQACPMNIQVSNQNIIKDHQCISCMECTSDYACPVKSTVEFKTR